MVDNTVDGSLVKYTVTCNKCQIAAISQCHPRSKPRHAATSIIKTTARTLGWAVGDHSTLCPTCRRNK